MENSDKTLLAFLLGAATGALTALLLAPTSGDKTRQRINKTASDTLYDAEDVWESNAERLKDLADMAINELEKYSKRITK